MSELFFHSLRRRRDLCVRLVSVSVRVRKGCWSVVLLLWMLMLVGAVVVAVVVVASAR